MIWVDGELCVFCEVNCGSCVLVGVVEYVGSWRVGYIVS